MRAAESRPSYPGVRHLTERIFHRPRIAPKISPFPSKPRWWLAPPFQGLGYRRVESGMFASSEFWCAQISWCFLWRRILGSAAWRNHFDASVLSSWETRDPRAMGIRSGIKTCKQQSQLILREKKNSLRQSRHRPADGRCSFFSLR